MEWIEGALPSVIAGAIVMIMVLLILKSKVKERKQGGCGCGCPGCTGSCPHSAVSSIEHKEAENET